MPLSNGVKGYIMVDYDCEIQSWTLLGDADGLISIDIWLSTYTGFPPVSSTYSITDFPTNNPRISVSSQKATGSPTSWNTGEVDPLKIPAGSILAYFVDEASSITRCTVAMKVLRY